MTPREQYLSDLAVKAQIERGIYMNPDGAIQKAIGDHGFWMVVGEQYDGQTAFSRAEHRVTGEARTYFWEPGKGTWYVVNRPGKDDSKPPPTGNTSVRVGLHANADPNITGAERAEFRALRPGIIKLLSFHNPEGVRALASEFGGIQWIVRAFLDFGGRVIKPQQFYDDTISDLRRTIGILKAHNIPDSNIFIEVHNEPNLVSEGYGTSWKTAYEFGNWFLYVITLYQKEFPYGMLFPGLSPGNKIEGVRPVTNFDFIGVNKHVLKAPGVAGVGVHAYWSGDSIDEGLAEADAFTRILPGYRLWVTEASNNKTWGIGYKAEQYALFVGNLSTQYEGVCFFVADASNPTFKEEVWVGNHMGAQVRRKLDQVGIR